LLSNILFLKDFLSYSFEWIELNAIDFFHEISFFGGILRVYSENSKVDEIGMYII
jgi:hypothetical protein